MTGHRHVAGRTGRNPGRAWSIVVLTAVLATLMLPIRQSWGLPDRDTENGQAPAGNLALGDVASASSSESPQLGARRAVDGRRVTRWSSEFGATASPQQWWMVDLGSVNTVGRVVIFWEAAYAKDYDVEISADGLTWTTPVTVREATAASTRSHSFPEGAARYVRVMMTAKGTQWGYSFWEVRVYGRPSPPPSPSPPSGVGQSNFFHNAATPWDQWVQPVSGDCRTFFQGRYQQMLFYPPYSDPCMAAGYTGGLGYQDVQAIYKDGAGNPQAPQWVLKDSAGQNTYVNWGCGGGTCPLFAADIGSQAFRDNYINEARRWMEFGYRGIFIDDANWHMNVSDRWGNGLAPIDPRTGAAMTIDDWRRYMADFIEQVQAAFPTKEIVINSVWWRSESSLTNPDVLRGVRAATQWYLERGTDDVRLGQSWEALLAHIDTLQTLGADVILDNYYADTRLEAEFEMATYFLISTGNDTYSADYRSRPDDFWGAYTTSLGEPIGPRYVMGNGVYRRDFSGGVVLVNEPAAGGTQTVSLGATYVDLDGVSRTSVTLAPGQAWVLRR
ncbi:MAG: discoidin domain-containing protein [Geodermatophilaceae bacterium]